jgi:hypothetical protein
MLEFNTALECLDIKIGGISPEPFILVYLRMIRRENLIPY